MKCEEYLYGCMVDYPGLYCGRSLEAAKFAVCDQFFNVIGNGIRDDEELIEDIESRADLVIPEDMEKFANDIYFFATREDRGSVDHDIPAVNEEGKKKYPHVKKWIAYTSPKNPIRFKDIMDDIKNPYPNFQKEYSLVWRCPKFLTLGNDWLECAIWFYNKCLKYFESKSCNSYSSAFPASIEEETAYRLRNFAELTEGRYESYEALSKAYGGVEYDGDNYKFLCRRWEKERARIIEYIKETITFLESHIK